MACAAPIGHLGARCAYRSLAIDISGSMPVEHLGARCPSSSHPEEPLQLEITERFIEAL
jgi:hypothetical protein